MEKKSEPKMNAKLVEKFKAELEAICKNESNGIIVIATEKGTNLSCSLYVSKLSRLGMHAVVRKLMETADPEMSKIASAVAKAMTHSLLGGCPKKPVKK